MRKSAGRQRGRRWTAWPALAVLVVWAASACTSHPSTPSAASPGELVLDMSAGAASVAGSGSSHRVDTHSGVSVGDRITVEAGGLAVLHLGSGLTFESEGPGVVLITALDRVQLVSGALLGAVTARGEVDGEGYTATSSDGTFRLDGGPAPRLGVYAGSATLAVSSGSLTVPAFRQAVLTTGALPGSPMPLQYAAANDTWDHRYLQDAIDLDNRLTSFGTGLDAQLSGLSGTAFARVVIPDTAQVAYLAPFYSEPRSAVLIGYTIASKAASEAGVDTPTTFNTVMSLWKGKDTWGLIAKEFKVSADSLFAGLQDAIARAGITGTGPTPRFPTTVAVPTATASTPPATQPGPTSTTTPATTTTPTPAASPGGLSLGPLLVPVSQLLNGLLGLLFPQPTQTVTP